MFNDFYIALKKFFDNFFDKSNSYKLTDLVHYVQYFQKYKYGLSLVFANGRLCLFYPTK